MNKFEKAFNKIKKLEAGYVFDKDDKGGETYEGIARNYHPDWEGWGIIDQLKNEKKFPESLKSNKELNAAVKSFYKDKFWDVLELDNYPDIIALELFEEAVNCGIKRAVRFMQNTANILNNNQKYYPDIRVDGVLGKKTKEAFAKCIKRHDKQTVFNVLNIFQGAFYLELMIKNPVYEKYIGWFKRVEVDNGAS